MTATTTTIAHLKITLDDVKPEVLRRIEVPFNIRLDRLHLTIQAAMGWTNSHLYEIRAGDIGWSTPYPDADWSGDFLDARKARLDHVPEDIGTKKLVYIYDFGDGWEHTIKVERLADPEHGVGARTGSEQCHEQARSFVGCGRWMDGWVVVGKLPQRAIEKYGLHSRPRAVYASGEGGLEVLCMFTEYRVF